MDIQLSGLISTNNIIRAKKNEIIRHKPLARWNFVPFAPGTRS